MVGMTYGTMPDRELFSVHFEREVPGGYLRIRNNRTLEQLGFGLSVDLTEHETWELVTALVKQWEDGSESAGFEASSIMQALGFEWI